MVGILSDIEDRKPWTKSLPYVLDVKVAPQASCLLCAHELLGVDDDTNSSVLWGSLPSLSSSSSLPSRGGVAIRVSLAKPSPPEFSGWGELSTSMRTVLGGLAAGALDVTAVLLLGPASKSLLLGFCATAPRV